VDDADVMHLLKIMLKANGKRGVPQGGVIPPLLSNLYLTELDRAKETTRNGKLAPLAAHRARGDAQPRTAAPGDLHQAAP
jgi:retron-type reverse transcriptase